MKRTFLFGGGAGSPVPLVAGGLALVAATYGLVRLAYGLLLPDVQRDLGLDVVAAGAVSAGASATYCACAIVGFLLAARRPRTLVVAAAVGGTIGAIGMATAADAGAFAVAAILASSGAGLASPALVALLARDASTRTRPELQGIVNAGTGPGLAIAAGLAIAVADWRTVWIAAAVATTVAGAATLAAFRDARRDDDGRGAQHPCSAPQHRSVRCERSEPRREPAAHRAPERAPEDAPEPDEPGHGRPSRTWLASHATPILAALLMGAGSAAVWSFGRSILVEAGATSTLSIVAWIGIGIGGGLAVATARRLERLGARGAWTLTSVAIAASTAAIAVAAGLAPAAIAACVVFGWAYTAGTSALIAWTTSIDPARAASGTAMLFVVLVLGQAIGAAALGAAAPHAGLAGAFAIAAVVGLSAVAVPATDRIRRRRRPARVTAD